MKKCIIFFLSCFLLLIQIDWVNAHAFNTELSSVAKIEPGESLVVALSVKNLPESEAFESDVVFDSTKLTLVLQEEVVNGMSVFVGRRILIDFNQILSGDFELIQLIFVPTENFAVGDCVWIALKDPSATNGWVDRSGIDSSIRVCMEEKDAIPPEITILPYDTTRTNQNVTVYALTNEGTLNQESVNFVQNGSFTFVAVDEAGNESSVTVVITHIEKEIPVIVVQEYSLIPTHFPVTVSAWVNKGVLNQESVTFTQNGSFTFVAVDAAGNISEKTVVIDHILRTYMFTYSVVGIEDSIIFDTNLAIEGKSISYQLMHEDFKVYRFVVNGVDMSRELDEVANIQEDIHIEFHVVLTGDVNHDGKLSPTDLVMLRRHLAGLIKLDEVALFSGDFNNDSRISATDMVRCRSKLAGLE